MKKLISMIVAFAMILTLGVPALAAEDTQTIYIENTNNWTTVYAYAWNDDSIGLLGDWPGTAMTNVEGEENIYSVEVPADALYMIFSNGSDQTADQNIPTDGKNLYNSGSGTWSTYGSTGGITVSGGTTGDVTATYTPTAKITGVSITVDGTTYTSGDVIITPESDVTLSVTGTNLQYGTEDNRVDYSASIGVPVTDDYFTFSDDGTDATYDIVPSNFSNSSNFEIVYYNDYTTNKTRNSTGIYVTYVDGTEPEPTYVSFTAKLIAVDSTGVVVDGVLGYLDGDYAIDVDSSIFNEIALGAHTVTNFVVNAGGYKTPADIALTIADADSDGVGEVSTTSSHASVALVDGVYVITVTLEAVGTEDATAEITGVSITVDGTTYTEGDVAITPDSTVTLTVTGTNLQTGTMDNRVDYSADYGYPVTDGYFTFSDDGTTATSDISAGDFSNSSNYEIVYYNNYTAEYADRTPNSTGIYVTYDDGTTYDVNISTVTDGSITVDKAKAAAGETVTVSVEANAGYAYKVNSLKVINDTTNEEVEVNEDAKTFVMPASSVTVTAEFEKLTTTSAEIVWGSLSFTYTDGENGADGAWSNDGTEGAGTVTVKNTGDTTFAAQPVYTAVADYDEIVAKFYHSEDPESPTTMGFALDSGESVTIIMKLFNKPEKAIPAGTKIGTVTIRITEGAPA